MWCKLVACLAIRLQASRSTSPYSAPQNFSYFAASSRPFCVILAIGEGSFSGFSSGGLLSAAARRVMVAPLCRSRSGVAQLCDGRRFQGFELGQRSFVSLAYKLIRNLAKIHVWIPTLGLAAPIVL